MELLLLGGDRRMLFAAQSLKKKGYDTLVGGFEPQEDFEALRFVKGCAWRGALGHCDAAVLPLFTKNSKGRDILRADFFDEELSAKEIVSLVTPGQTVLAGLPPRELRQLFFAKGIAVFDYLACQEAAIANAVPTAQGVLAILFRELETAVAGCTICVTGYGRCARALARVLRGIGARVAVAARKRRDLAQALAEGCEPIALEELADSPRRFDALVNTIPAQCLGEKQLAALGKACLLIEIAGAPFGIDSQAARRLGMHYILAQGLPGKAAPKTAGLIIADTVHSILRELRRSAG
ncbi:MAG: hypothetical protein LBQ80_05815 [Clostridium sp.]|jgi:dipicolinate synthase subunit A|nr:hypothetical protein [Clostridium sp.]